MRLHTRRMQIIYEALDRTKKSEEDGVCGCGNEADHDPMDVVYVLGEYVHLGRWLCSDCYAEVEEGVLEGETASQIEKYMGLHT